jgi:outer membrane protein OmpA-like peptidoglycan-associated protein
MFSCASTKPASSVPVADLNIAVSEAAALRREADNRQSDLLAFREYTNGTRYLTRAEKGLAEDYKSDYILENTELAKRNLQQAIDLSETRRTNAPNILQARRASLDAGLKDSPALQEDLDDVDEQARGVTNDFSRALNPEEFSKFQKQYLSLEVKAVQFRELNPVQQAIQKSVSKNADNLAPKALNTAMLAVNDAENLIAQSPRDPAVYEQSVKDAIASSELLTEIMDVIANAKGTPENIALKIVMQNRELGALSKNVGQLEQNLQTTQTNLQTTQTDLEATRSDLTRKEGALEMQSEELKTAKSILLEAEGAMKLQSAELRQTSTQVRFQNAMNEAVKQFPADEAEVYQQGSNLIFRLKKINFPSGSSVTPNASKPLLLKVNEIITTLIGAELVIVEGHTDSVGPDEQNQVLSTNRAISVSEYLASLAGGYEIGYAGYGKSRPIANNDSAEGRAINRRVDLVVTAAN